MKSIMFWWFVKSQNSSRRSVSLPEVYSSLHGVVSIFILFYLKQVLLALFLLIY